MVRIAESRVLGRASIAALVLHIAIVIALALIPRPASKTARPIEDPTKTAEIAIDEDVDLGKSSEGTATGEPSDEPAKIAARSEARPSDNVGQESEASSPSPSPSSSTAPSPSGVTFGGPDIGIGRANPFLTNGSTPESKDHEWTEAERQASAKEQVDQALRQPARQRERELGLGPEGPVLHALGEATETSTAPVRGRALFLATANGAGDVVSISVLECDGSNPAWSEAARLALAALKGKKLRMPSTAKRAEMKIEVTSAWKLPSGQDPGVSVDLLHIPIAKGEGKDSPKVSILDPIPKIHVTDLGNGLVLPAVSVEITVFATTIDPSNVGAKPRRVVHTRLVDSTVL